MPVMTMAMRMHLYFLYRHHAPMRHFAIYIFKLNRRVSNVKTIMERRLNLRENPIAFRRRDIGNRHMAG